MKLLNIKIETRIAIFYAIFGGLWILFSDTLLAKLVPDYALYTKLQTYKGWLFVAVSALLIFSLIRRESARREEALGRFEFLLKHSRDVILFIRGEDGRIVDANAAAAQAYGYSHDELLSLTIHDLRASGTRDMTQAQMQQADAGGILFETVHRRKDGSSVPVEVSSAGETIGGVRTVVSIVRDISERKQTEENLRENEERLRLSLHAANQGLYDLNVQTGVAIVNEEYARMLGYDPETFHETNAAWIERLHPDDMEITQKAYQDYTSGILPEYRVEFRQKTRDGNWKWILSLGKIVEYDEQGQPLRMLGTHTDITERKQAEMNLQWTLHELRRSNMELEEFAYVASHDLQEPLRGIAGLAQLLQQRYHGQLDSNADEFIDLIVDGTQRMQTLINDLLAYSRIGRRGENIKSIEAEAALKSTLGNLNAAIVEYGATITSESLPRVRADATQLVQLFQNLIGNAIKFRADRPPHIHIGASSAGDFWKFSIADNGIGIEPQYFERIFQVFQRLHTRREYKGTGIGLAICKKIVDRHGGQIWVESTPGQGSTFYFTLPKGN